MARKNPKTVTARFAIGDIVRHRIYPFRGVIFDVDPEFANTEEWYESIPEDMRPRRDQPFYHLFAENAETEYIAYVSEQNLLPDESGEPGPAPAGAGGVRMGIGRQALSDSAGSGALNQPVAAPFCSATWRIASAIVSASCAPMTA